MNGSSVVGLPGCPVHVQDQLEQTESSNEGSRCWDFVKPGTFSGLFAQTCDSLGTNTQPPGVDVNSRSLERKEDDTEHRHPSRPEGDQRVRL
jgi:hypothetical protein